MKTLIKNAQCVLPEGTTRTNILIEGSTIADIDPAASITADEVIDATGLHLLPGVIDDQVHFRDPGLTHKEDIHTGSLASARGGVTTFLDMPNVNPAMTTCELLERRLELAASKAVVNYGFYIGATPDNIDELKKARRTPGIKIFIGSSTGNLLVDGQDSLERIFAETTLPICAHCEDEKTVRENAERLGGGKSFADHSRIRDHEAALIATRRAVDLSTRHRHPFHVLHVSTAAEVEFLKSAPDWVTSEVCPHHLYFSVEDYDRLGSLVQMNPSVKNREDCEALWKALAEGDIDVVATDHAPHLLEEKDKPYPQSPSGVPAVENLLALMLDGVSRGRLTLDRLVRTMSENPARIWNMKGKGSIAVGHDADLVLVDQQKPHPVRNEDQITRAGWSPWHGVDLMGSPVRTLIMGRTVYANGRLDRTPHGQEVLFDRGG
ncbi:MAG: dihydroorotase [Candidatus Sumerlaeia bacterium]|nr:dihydroorotase [Candidatus Sumerlaeia bacterium]